MNLIGQNNIDITKQPSSGNGMMYGCSVGASCHEAHGMLSPAVDGNVPTEPCVTVGKDKSVGKEKAFAVGCNANNDNASSRSANSNNACSNSNANYAGALAVNQVEDSRKNLTTRPTRLNIANTHTATGGYGLVDCRSLPFWGESTEADGTIGDGVKPMKATHEGNILEELKTANHKKKLRNLKRFLTDPVIVRMGVDRCLERVSDSPEVRKITNEKEAVIQRIIRELTDETYRCQPTVRRIIEKKGKGDKNRNADIYTVYDRCIQNILLIVIKEKLTNVISPHCYSGIEGRSLWSNYKRWCMVNKIRTYVKNHSGASAGLTDIRRFYETLRSEVVLGVAFETITCPFTRRLLCDILLQHETLVIGGTLSQILAMLTLTDMDNELTKRFKPQFYGAFGDNRIIMDDDREKVVEAVHWEMSYLEGRYGMEMKKDWQVVRIKNGFMFCKQKFKGSFVNVRAELRRRAIRAAGRGRQNYAGYHGMLMKTDSRRLIQLIKNDIRRLKRMKNQKGMSVRPMTGDNIKLDKVEGMQIVITDYSIRQNHKDSEFFVRFQFVAIGDDGSKHLYVTNNGSFEIKEFFKLAEEGKVKLPLKTKICAEGKSFYFEGYHTTSQEACELLCTKLGI